MDKQKVITKLELAKASNLSKSTISTLCNNPDYHPRFLTIIKISQGL
ncbi:helix-turn-helix domain-containing protein [Priestia megaterium]